MISKPGPNLSRSLRLIVATFGGYAFAAGFVALVATGLPNLGMPRTESTTLGGMLGILVYLAIIVWAVSSTRPIRATVIISTAAVFMIIVAPLMMD